MYHPYYTLKDFRENNLLEIPIYYCYTDKDFLNFLNIYVNCNYDNHQPAKSIHCLDFSIETHLYCVRVVFLYKVY